MKKFIQEKAKNRARLKLAWRRPKGAQSKVRCCIRGHQAMPKIGYKKKEKQKITLIKNIKNLENAEKMVVLSKNLGKKKKIEIVKKALEKNLVIINFKKPEEQLNTQKNEMSDKK